MAWDNDMIAVLRTLLQDTAAAPKYDDGSLATMVLVATLSLGVEYEFASGYAADISNGTLSPDPTLPATRDNGFVSACCLRAARDLIDAELRDLARQGIDIQDGKSRISLKRDPAALKLMRDSYNERYEKAVYALHSGIGFGEAIVSPYPLFPPAAAPGGFSGHSPWHEEGNIGGLWP